MSNAPAAAGVWTNLFPPKAKWSINEIPDQTGKVVLVTGYGGIGKETARVLLTKNAKVYVAGRNEQAGNEAVASLTKETGKKAYFLKLDLANLKAIKASAEDFATKESKLDVLINNAGVMFPPIDKITSDGYDLQFGTNTLGHAYFTMLLLPLLRTAVKSSSDGHARVVNVSSMGHMLFFPNLDFDTFKDGPKRLTMDPQKLYGQSKFGNIVFSNELARRFGSEGIISISLHPGNIKTDLGRYSGSIQALLTNWMLYPIPLGALTQLYAATMPEALKLNGKYMLPWARVGNPHPATAEPEFGTKLWDWVEEQVKDV
ncbi:hypothetical protein FB45DRAFT_1054248 [Roridomyces roridus]|uniref:NAD(P)-binding protein n=1 Tax=Roridomyces roridus TaxID=1738132 RepID=A0AAD7C8X8_9AGAR|nr:hypothetical protein FB45DRAFT_1054248 [Roridomyces roridus]